MNTMISPVPFDTLGRKLVGLLIIFLALIWFMGIYAYTTLPDTIPTHFGVSGKPDAFGTRITFLLLPIAFSLAPAIILLIVKFRFTLINKYPYLINLPAFYTSLSGLREERKSFWINKYFELVAAIGVFVSIFLLALFLGIYAGTIEGRMPMWFTIVILVVPLVLIVSIVLALRSMSVQLKDELG